MRPVFADPKTDFVFRRLFGTEEHRDLLIGLLDALLGLDDAHRIVDLVFLREEQRPRVAEMKHSIVDVKCRDATGTSYVVEMQVLNVEGFEKRVVYNASKAYVSQLGRGASYPTLDDVVAVSICDFVLFDAREDEPPVPLVSRWRMQEHGGRLGLSQVRYVFVELPKLPQDRLPEGVLEEWAWFFRNAETLDAVPTTLRSAVPRKALEAARTAGFSEEEWEAYDRARIAEQDARGALSLAEKLGRAEGRAEGLTEGLRASVYDLCEVLGIALDVDRRAHVERLDELRLAALRDALKARRAWPDD